MAHITWGVTRTESGDSRCTIFCADCRMVLIRDLSVCEAAVIRDEVEHDCKGQNSKEVRQPGGAGPTDP